MNHYDTPTQASIAKRKTPMPFRPITSTFSEIYKLKKTLKDLKRDANETLKVEIESQKTFDYLISQIKTLRDAIIPIADVLVEEVDVTREEFIQRNKDLEERVNGMQNQFYQMDTEMTFLKSEINACKSRLDYTEMLNGSSAKVQAQEKISKMMEEMLKTTNNQLMTQTIELADKVDTFNIRQERMEDDFGKVKKILKEVRRNLAAETGALHQAVTSITDDSKTRDATIGLAVAKLEGTMENLNKQSQKGLTALATDILTLSEKQKDFSEHLEQLQTNIQQKADSEKCTTLVGEQETNFKHNFEKLTSSVQMLSNKVKGNMITLQEQIQQVQQEIQMSKGGQLENSTKIEKKVNALQSAVQQIIESVTLTPIKRFD